jgi:NACHT domain- and WD repeat-containing protein
VPSNIPSFRVFVSSTFSDMQEERNALRARVFPRLSALCRSHGTTFQAVDLRWGVNREASENHQTVSICLQEIDRCRAAGRRPDFIVLLGQRYGWCPVPAEIPDADYKLIRSLLSSLGDERLKVLNQRYLLDENTIPPVYRLDAQTGTLDRPVTVPTMERELRGILLDAVGRLHFDPARRVRYTASATEQEIVYRGLLDDSQEFESVLCFFRRIDGLPDDSRAAEFLDVSGNQLDAEAAELLEQLKRRLRHRLSGNVHDYVVRWGDQAGWATYVNRLCDDVHDRLAQAILEEVANRVPVPPHRADVGAHEAVAEDRRRHFVGRNEERDIVQAYLRSPARHPLVLTGRSGTGKSSLIAQAAEEAHAADPDAEVVLRFIGATPESTNIRTLLSDIAAQIGERFHLDETVEVDTYQHVVDLFWRRLRVARKNRPIIIFLDALDQLAASYDASIQRWLPLRLPPHVRLVVSALPGRHLTALRNALDDRACYELGAMPVAEGAMLLDQWLEAARRRLQKDQRRRILAAFAANGTPLHLRLAFEQARGWRSTDLAMAMPRHSTDIFRSYLRRLSSPDQHGGVLISRSLSYLAASRNGLSHDELLQVLSEDEHVMADLREREPESPDAEELPDVVWSRLYYDLLPYLTERDGGGSTTLGFFHRLLRQTVAEDYLRGKSATRRHRALAEHFSRQPNDFDGREVSGTPNLRKLGELPYQLARADKWPEFRDTLLDFGFLRSKISALGPRPAIEDFELPAALGTEKRMRAAIGDTTALELTRKAIDLSANALTRNAPGHLMSQLWGRLHACPDPLVQGLLEHAEDLSAAPWLRTLGGSLTAPNQHSGRILEGHLGAVFGIHITTDGTQVISASQDGTLRVWNIHTGTTEVRLDAKGVVAFDVSPDERTVVAGCGNGKLIAWDLQAGRELFQVRAHSSHITAVACTLDSTRVASASYDGTIQVWDLASGRKMRKFDRHHQGITHLAMHPDGRSAISADLGRKFLVWHLETGKLLCRFEQHRGYPKAMAVSPDGKTVVSSDLEQRTIAWRTRSGRNLFYLPQPGDPFADDDEDYTMYALAFTPNGRTVVGGCGSGDLMIWNARTGTARELTSTRRLRKGVPVPFQAVAVTPDNRTVLAASGNELTVWDLKTRKEVGTFEGHAGTITALAVSTDGQTAISASDDASLMVWSLGQPAPTEASTLADKTGRRQGHTEAVTGIVVSRTLGRTVTSSRDEDVKLWDSNTGAEIQKLERVHHRPVIGLGISPDGRRAFTTIEFEQLNAYVWDIETGALISQFSGNYHSRLDAFAAAPHGDRVLVALSDWGWSSEGDESRTDEITVWETVGSRRPRKLRGHNKKVRAIAFSGDGQLAVSGSDDQRLIVWDITGGRRLATLRGHTGPITDVAMPAAGRTAISTSEDGTARLWDLAEARQLTVSSNPEGAIEHVAVSADGSTAVLCSADGSLGVWDIVGADAPVWLVGHSAAVTCLEMSPGGEVVVTASQDRTLKVWNLPGRQLIASFRGESPVNVCAIARSDLFICGEDSGAVHFLQMENAEVGLWSIRPPHPARSET